MRTRLKQEAIRDALAKIADENSGRLTPDAVIAKASSKNSVLHDLFEWDAKKAAHAWRLDQARTLISSVRVVITNEKTTILTIAYVRDPDAAPDQQGYRSTASMIGDKERARTVLIDEFGRAAAALRRARELALVFDMVDQVDAVTTTVEHLRTLVESRAEERRQ